MHRRVCSSNVSPVLFASSSSITRRAIHEDKSRPSHYPRPTDGTGSSVLPRIGGSTESEALLNNSQTALGRAVGGTNHLRTTREGELRGPRFLRKGPG